MWRQVHEEVCRPYTDRWDLLPNFKATSLTNSDSSDESSDSGMLLHCRPCIPNGPPDNIPTSPSMSENSSEENCTFFPYRIMCQWRPGVSLSSMEESKTAPPTMKHTAKRVSTWLLFLWSRDQEEVYRRYSLTFKKTEGMCMLDDIGARLQIKN